MCVELSSSRLSPIPVSPRESTVLVVWVGLAWLGWAGFSWFLVKGCHQSMPPRQPALFLSLLSPSKLICGGVFEQRSAGVLSLVCFSKTITAARKYFLKPYYLSSSRDEHSHFNCCFFLPALHWSKDYPVIMQEFLVQVPDPKSTWLHARAGTITACTVTNPAKNIFLEISDRVTNKVALFPCLFLCVF